MKINLILTSIFTTIIFLAISCEKDDVFYPDSEVDGTLKSAELKEIPIKGELQSHVTEALNGIPVYGTLSGNISHLGKLIADKSTWYTISVEMNEQTLTISWELLGSVCAANGDFLKYTLSGSFNIPENELSGEVDFDGGTGRFCQAQGSMNFTGYADDPVNITTMIMQVEGMITNVGSSFGDENATVKQNESIARSFIEAWDTHDTDLLTSLFADDFIYTEVTTGRFWTDKDELALYANATYAGLPDTRFEVVSIVANEQFAAVEWIWKATNTVGWPYLGIPATGNYFEMPGASVMEIENGKIIWNKDYWDWDTFMQLLGVGQ